MKGLLLKDWFVLWKYAKFNIGLAFIFIVLSIVNLNPLFPLMSVLFFSMLPLTAMGLDERCRWDAYASTMPYSRTHLVVSRYLLAFLGTACCIVLFLVISVIGIVFNNHPSDFSAVLGFVSTMVCMGMLIPAITMPISFKLGVEKSRITYMLIAAIIAIAISVFCNTQAEALHILSGLPASALPVICTILFILSACLSIKIYKKRDL